MSVAYGEGNHHFQMLIDKRDLRGQKSPSLSLTSNGMGSVGVTRVGCNQAITRGSCVRRRLDY
jgi:hypothetical protein